MDKKLSERKQKILKAVVDEYIKSATPISSGEIKAKHFDSLSSATIRSELSTLEDMGYLVQPHTSSGRVPSKAAYEMYVSHFLELQSLNTKELEMINKGFSKHFDQVEDIVKRTAKIISDVTNYTSVIVLKNINKVKLKEIKLVDLDEHSALLVIITDSGIIRDKVITLDNIIDKNYIRDANILLNKIFSGRTVAELKNSNIFIEQEMSKFQELFSNILGILTRYCDQTENDIFIEGTSKLLSHPDSNIESAMNFLSIIDTKKDIADLITSTDDIEFSIKIGKDANGGIDKYSVVSAKYKLNGKDIGHAGIIGPERMDYSKVLSVLQYIGSTLSVIVDNNGGSNETKKD